MSVLTGMKLDDIVWRALCVDCCRVIYSENNFHAIPDVNNGAGAIGFTKEIESKIIQSHHPDQEDLSSNDIFESQKDKIYNSLDILLDNFNYFKSLGVSKVNEWVFMIDSYADISILEYVKLQEDRILSDKTLEAIKANFFSEEFKIVIKVEEDFKEALIKAQRNSIVRAPLVMREDSVIDWEQTDSSLKENVEKKLCAINSSLNDAPGRLNSLTDRYMRTYAAYESTMKTLGEDNPTVREDLLKCESLFKNRVEKKCLLNSGNMLNTDIFQELEEQFENEIKESIDYLKRGEITNFREQVVSKWLADCTMKFY